jgi:hypothetical protein
MFAPRGRGPGEEQGHPSFAALKFGQLPSTVRARVESADADTLLRRSERVLIAETLDAVLQQVCTPLPTKMPRKHWERNRVPDSIHAATEDGVPFISSSTLFPHPEDRWA